MCAGAALCGAAALGGASPPALSCRPVPQPWFRDLLACPDCQRPLDLGAGACECGFAVPAGTPLDLRPKNPRPFTGTFARASTAPEALAACLVERPKLTYSGPRALRDSAELFSAAEPWLAAGKSILDVGCGPRDQYQAAAHYGLSYVGIDVASHDADVLADAHAIPLGGESVDAVLAYAVLEHLYNPFIAVSEVTRVLKPGGIFFGAVSQGEPFHHSYFHHTAFGLLDVLHAGGLRPLRLWPSYDTLHALAVMGRYPRVVRLLLEAVYRLTKAAPMLAPRKFFGWSARDKQLDELHRAASISFVARKDGA